MPPYVPLPRHKTLPTPILPFSSNLSNTAILIPNYFPPSLTTYAWVGKHLLNVISKLRLICLLNGWRYQTNFRVIFVGNIIHSHHLIIAMIRSTFHFYFLKKKIRFTKWGKYGCRWILFPRRRKIWPKLLSKVWRIPTNHFITVLWTVFLRIANKKASPTDRQSEVQYHLNLC